MDDSTGQDRRPGGTVEPIKRAAAPKERLDAYSEPPGRRYELIDPFAGVKHRATTFDEMVVKADRAGAIRFQAIDADESRLQVEKVDGSWQRPGPPLHLHELNRDEAVRVTKTAAQVKADKAAPAHDASTTASKVVQLAAPAARPDQAATADATVERAAQVSKLQAALNERYVIKRAFVKVGAVQIGQTEYRFRGDNSRVAFTESTTRLATDTNSPSVARSMVDVAQARNWQALRVAGNEDFKRMVWLEATVRNVRTMGYEPVPGDLELLQKARDARQVNRIEPLADIGSQGPGAAADKPSARGGGGRKAVLAALEAVLIDRKIPDKQRQAVMTAAVENLARRQAAGQTLKVKVYDKAALSQRPVVMPTPEVQRSRERATPAPAR